MVLNLTGCNRFTTAGRERSDFGWSWTLQIARVTLHDCEVAPLTSKTLARPIFHCLLDRLLIRISTLDLHHWILRKKIIQIRTYDFGEQFSLIILKYATTRIGEKERETVCVRESERDSVCEREREIVRERVRVCVCVWEREREREREREERPARHLTSLGRVGSTAWRTPTWNICPCSSHSRPSWFVRHHCHDAEAGQCAC